MTVAGNLDLAEDNVVVVEKIAADEKLNPRDFGLKHLIFSGEPGASIAGGLCTAAISSRQSDVFARTSSGVMRTS